MRELVLTFLRSYPYFFANLPLLFIMLLAAKTVWPRHYGRLTLLCGVAGIPCAALALIHEKSYWTPLRLGGLPLGVEDLVFSFVCGSMVWFAAGWPFRHRLAGAPRLSTFFPRALLSGLIFGAICWALWRLGVKGLDNTLAAGICSLVILAVFRIDLLPLAGTGILLFVPAYYFIVILQFKIWPDYILQWNPAAFGGAVILGVPAGEIAWAVTFAAVWPLMMGFFFDVRWADKTRTEAENLGLGRIGSARS